MKLNELKQSMSTLDQVLAKTNSDLKIDVSASETAKTKILRNYRKNIRSCAVLSLVFGCLWVCNVSPEKLPDSSKAFLAIILAVATVWYVFLYTQLKKIDISACSPAALIRKTSSFKILNLTGEIVLGIGIVVFFTLHIRSLWTAHSEVAFWATVITLSVAIFFFSLFLLPRYIKLFRDLNSIREN